jgi:hypothetical protein
VANNRDSGQVEVKAVRDQAREMIDPHLHIIKGARPSAGRFPKTAILHIPYGKTLKEEILRDGCHLVPAVWHSPEAAMKKTDHGKASASRKIQISLLGFEWSITYGVPVDREHIFVSLQYLECFLRVPAYIPNRLPAGLHRTYKENIMPQSTHDRASELHNLAAHAHTAAAEAHGKADYRAAHEFSRQALEHSTNAYKCSEQLFKEAEKHRKG